jgi:hypothetical protein
MGEEIPEEIHTECLDVTDRVFVSYDPAKMEIRTATKHFWRRYESHIWVARLIQPLISVPKPGSTIRVTDWHGGLPVKIEAEGEGPWEVIYEIDRLPPGLHCLAGCYKKT